MGMRRELEDLGHLLGILLGSRTPGAKPAGGRNNETGLIRLFT